MLRPAFDAVLTPNFVLAASRGQPPGTGSGRGGAAAAVPGQRAVHPHRDAHRDQGSGCSEVRLLRCACTGVSFLSVVTDATCCGVHAQGRTLRDRNCVIGF